MTQQQTSVRIAAIFLRYARVPNPVPKLGWLRTATFEQCGINESRRRDLAVALEQEFGVSLDREAVAHWETFDDVVRDVENMLVNRVVPVPGVYTKEQSDRGILASSQLPPLDTGTATTAAAINRITRDDVAQFANTFLVDDYQRIATKSAIYPGKGTPLGLMYVALGLAEAGEVQNKVKKAFRDDGVLQIDSLSAGKRLTAVVSFNTIAPERRAAIIKELGGVLWYIAAVCDEIGATMSEVALQNLDELCGRGERNTLRGDGDDR